MNTAYCHGDCSGNIELSKMLEAHQCRNDIRRATHQYWNDTRGACDFNSQQKRTRVTK